MLSIALLLEVMKERLYSRASGTGKNLEKLKDIGKHFGIGESGVSQACRRVSHKIDRDKKLKRKIGNIEKKMKLSRPKTPMFSKNG